MYARPPRHSTNRIRDGNVGTARAFPGYNVPEFGIEISEKAQPVCIVKLWINKAAGAVQEQRNNSPIWIILIFSVIYKGLRRTLDTNPRRPVNSQSLGSIRHPLELSLDLHHGRQVELKSRAAPRGADRP